MRRRAINSVPQECTHPPADTGGSFFGDAIPLATLHQIPVDTRTADRRDLHVATLAEALNDVRTLVGGCIASISSNDRKSSSFNWQSESRYDERR